MQTQKQKTEASLTEKQDKFIQSLKERGFVDVEVSTKNLTKREASAIIDAGLLLAKEAALEDEGHDEFNAPSKDSSHKEEFNKYRFGMCTKLVYSKNEHNVSVPKGADTFKAEVRQLYKVVADLERELQSSLSSRNGGD